MAHAWAGQWEQRREHSTGAVLLRVKRRMARDRLSIIAAGVAFYALMAIFPGLVALVAVYGLVFDPQQVSEQMAALGDMLPPQAKEVLLGQLNDLVSTDRAALGVGAAIGVVLALWSASAGIRTLMEALNVAYEEEERRGMLKFYGTALLLTLGAILGVSAVIAIIVAVPVVAKFLGLGSLAETLVSLVRWPVVAVAVLLGLAILYRYAPCRKEPRWQWVSHGALIATLLWLIGSVLFSLYVTFFASYNQTYGSAGAVVILLTWFLLSAYVILIGALLNAESERHQARRLQATGRPNPGERS
jgi:membrane protein